MFRKGIVLGALGMLLMIPSFSKAAVNNPWEITIGGGGSNSNDFNGFTANVNGSIGYYFSENLELSVRQSLQYSDVSGSGGGGSSWDGSTRVALDLHFPMGQNGNIVPYIGANVGYVYGQSVSDTWEAAPEAGVKVYLNSTTFVFASAEYQFFFDKASHASDTFSDGQFVYTIGLGFRF